MTNPIETLPVLFRAERSGPHKGDVTAVFPTLPADYSGRMMTCYAHIGQHGACSWPWYRTTRPATESEYADLLAELQRIYGTSHAPGDPVYRLQVVKRITAAHRQAFEADLQHNLAHLGE